MKFHLPISHLLMLLLPLNTRLDLFLPTNNAEQVPVVVFVTGGAWIIGWEIWTSFSFTQLFFIKLMYQTLIHIFKWIMCPAKGQHLNATNSAIPMFWFENCSPGLHSEFGRHNISKSMHRNDGSEDMMQYDYCNL